MQAKEETKDEQVTIPDIEAPGSATASQAVAVTPAVPVVLPTTQTLADNAVSSTATAQPSSSQNGEITPVYSDYVQHYLDSGTIHLCWDKFVEETAYHNSDQAPWWSLLPDAWAYYDP